MSDLLLLSDRATRPTWADNLEADGHALRLVSGRDELLADLAAGPVDGVLVDHRHWPRLLAGAPVRVLAPRARVLVVTDPAHLSIRTDLDALGIDDLVFGPVDGKALCRRVRRRFPTDSLVASDR
ncbi:MAG: hypothetical protein GY929_19795 [Actinomycetia bacterium]|nr:hypothetical protein [Actinomycetes bacterium]